MKKLILALLMLPVASFAQDLSFDSISESDLEKVTSSFSANFTHTAVTGANTLGSIFGFEVGLIGGLTAVDELKSVIEDADPDSDAVGMIPHGGLLGIVSVPFGWTFEATLIPAFGDDSFKFSNMTAAVKWSITESVLSNLPLSIAIRGHYAQTNLDFQQDDPGAPGVTVDGSYENTVTGVQAVVSKNLLVFSPYAAIGMVQATGKMGVNGSASIYDPSFTASDSAEVDVSSTQIVIGGEFKLALLKIAAEYSQQFETQRYTAKFSFFF